MINIMNGGEESTLMNRSAGSEWVEGGKGGQKVIKEGSENNRGRDVWAK